MLLPPFRLLLICSFVGPAFAQCPIQPRHADLLPAFRTSPSMISDEGKGKGYVEEQAHGSGDDWSAETTGGGAESGGCGAGSGGCGAGSGSIEAHDLCLEGEVRRHGCKPGAGSQAVAG